jgi:chemotaxis response regulator CheB
MPESAIASGCIDFILSPGEIAKEIIRIAKVEKIQE